MWIFVLCFCIQKSSSKCLTLLYWFLFVSRALAIWRHVLTMFILKASYNPIFLAHSLLLIIIIWLVSHLISVYTSFAQIVFVCRIPWIWTFDFAHQHYLITIMVSSSANSPFIIKSSLSFKKHTRHIVFITKFPPTVLAEIFRLRISG